jgi:hypothetical protein
MTLISLIAAVLILCIVCWIISILPLPSGSPPFIRTVLYIIVGIVIILWLMQIGGFVNLGLHHRL